MKTTDPDVCAKASQESSGQEQIHPFASTKTNSDTLDQLKLLKNSVEFEVRSNVPGVKYTTEGTNHGLLSESGDGHLQ